MIKAQAIKILGSVDFLGNPMGLFSDVASGVSGMLSVQPDVVGLVRDVAHGMSDTTSKVSNTGSIDNPLSIDFDPRGLIITGGVLSSGVRFVIITGDILISGGRFVLQEIIIGSVLISEV